MIALGLILSRFSILVLFTPGSIHWYLSCIFHTPDPNNNAKMVHINRVATSKEITDEKSQFEDISASTTINLSPDDEADDYTATVYGSKYAAEDLPRHEMPVS